MNVNLTPSLIFGQNEHDAKRVNLTHFRKRMGQGNSEGLYFIMAPYVTFQTVLAAKGLLTTITGAIEWLLPCGKNTYTFK